MTQDEITEAIHKLGIYLDREDTDWVLNTDDLRFFAVLVASAQRKPLLEEIERLRGIVPEVLERINDELCAENEALKLQLAAAIKVEHNTGDKK